MRIYNFGELRVSSLLKPLALLILSANIAWAHADTGCDNNLTTPYVASPVNQSTETSGRFGDRLRIFSPDHSPIEAFLIGAIHDRVYFAPTEAAGLTRPIFYLPLDVIQFRRVKKDETYEVITPLETPPAISEIYATNAPSMCAPQTVMACLSHLEQMGALSKLAQSELQKNPDRLFKEMAQSFSQEAVTRSEDWLKLQIALENADDRKTVSKLVDELRDFGFERAITFLKTLNISVQKTKSFGALNRHLESGRPAYISFSAGSLSVARPALSEWKEPSIPWDHPDIQTSTFPVPRWSPRYAGFHAVYAIGILPRANGLNGLLRGKRIVILDPSNNQLNILDTLVLRALGSPRFLLIGDSP